MISHPKILIPIFAVVLAITAFTAAHLAGFYFDHRDFSTGLQPVFGVSYRLDYAHYLSIDPKETALALFDDLKVKHIRLIIHWDQIEREAPGQFDFSFFDWFIKEAEKRNVKLIVNIGIRTAGWPEFHFPGWAVKLPENERKAAALAMIDETVGRYKNSSALDMWQVENEPLFKWGQLQQVENIYGIKFQVPDPDFLNKEIAEVKKLDNHPIIITDSGELSGWHDAAKAGDYFGPTLYRFIWQRIYGNSGARIYYGYMFPFGWMSPAYYRFKAQNLGLNLDKVFIMELQAEPWMRNESIIKSTPQLQAEIFGVKQFEDNIDFARRTGFHRAYLWGAEWWYYQKIHGNPDLWDAAKKLF